MNVEEFSERRRALLEAISPDIALVPSPPVALRNNDVEHAFRQGSDLYYLTGFLEQHACAVLSAQSAAPFTMFVRPRDPEREVWDGARAGTEGIVSTFGADKGLDVAQFDALLPDLLRGHRRVLLPLDLDPEWTARVLRAIGVAKRKCKRGGLYPTEVVELGSVLHEQRLKKSQAELECMRRAIELTGEAHMLAMQAVRPGMNEGEIEALFFSHCRAGGAARLAYESIVGSGPNATVLHYVQNNRQMQAGELVLLDAGCEVDHYASDITRTFPVSGVFSLEQAQVYDIVLSAQQLAIAACRVGQRLSEIQKIVVRKISEGLVDLGLLEGTVEDVIQSGSFKKYYMHNVSHYLGMDVHDVGAYYQGDVEVPLQAGVVVTIEPGIYIAQDAAVPARYRGIGIRIEDDILITEDGCDVLSYAIPKERADIEALASAARASEG